MGLLVDTPYIYLQNWGEKRKEKTKIVVNMTDAAKAKALI
jgi:hypothetical protein